MMLHVVPIGSIIYGRGGVPLFLCCVQRCIGMNFVNYINFFMRMGFARNSMQEIPI